LTIAIFFFVASLSAGLLTASNQKCEKALAVFHSQDYRAAIPLLKEAIESNECSSDYRLHLGVAQLNTGDLDTAQASLLRLLQDHPEVSSGWYNLGLIYFSRREFPLAVTAFENAVRYDPENSEALKMLGRIQVFLQQNAEAEKSFVAAMEQDQSDYESPYFLGRLYQSADRMKEAAKMFERSIRMKKDFGRAYAFLGTVCYALGENDRARRSFETAIALNQRKKLPPGERSSRPHPDFIPHLEYGIYLQRMGYLDDARAQLTRAHDLAPREIEPIFELSRIYYRSAEFDEARRLLTKGISLEGTDSRLHYLLGRVCYEQGDEECGDRHMELSEKNRK
jgi:tetratricopeptide (TPR) repeat protein